MNIEELNKDCPEHDRSSCSDASPINAGIDYRYGTTWCRRCEGLRNIRADARIAELVGLLSDCRDCVASDINHTLAQFHEPAAVDYLQALLMRVDAALARAGNGGEG